MGFLIFLYQYRVPPNYLIINQGNIGNILSPLEGGNLLNTVEIGQFWNTHKIEKKEFVFSKYNFRASTNAIGEDFECNNEFDKRNYSVDTYTAPITYEVIPRRVCSIRAITTNEYGNFPVDLDSTGVNVFCSCWYVVKI